MTSPLSSLGLDWTDAALTPSLRERATGANGDTLRSLWGEGVVDQLTVRCDLLLAFTLSQLWQLQAWVDTWQPRPCPPRVSRAVTVSSPIDLRVYPWMVPHLRKMADLLRDMVTGILPSMANMHRIPVVGEPWLRVR